MKMASTQSSSATGSWATPGLSGGRTSSKDDGTPLAAQSALALGDGEGRQPEVPSRRGQSLKANAMTAIPAAPPRGAPADAIAQLRRTAPR
jgi:hypothetical protein